MTESWFCCVVSDEHCPTQYTLLSMATLMWPSPSYHSYPHGQNRFYSHCRVFLDITGIPESSCLHGSTCGTTDLITSAFDMRPQGFHPSKEASITWRSALISIPCACFFGVSIASNLLRLLMQTSSSSTSVAITKFLRHCIHCFWVEYHGEQVSLPRLFAIFGTYLCHSCRTPPTAPIRSGYISSTTACL